MPSRLPSIGWLIIDFRSIYKKDVGVLLSLVPRIEALASPYQLNEQRRSPRQYEITNILASCAKMHGGKVWIHHTHGRHCCLVLD